MKKKGVTKVSLRQRGAWGFSGAARRSLRSAPWLISAAAAWLTFFPCGTAFAAHDWRDDGSAPSMERFPLKAQFLTLRKMNTG